ncbi:MAG: hypothetical protein U1E38_10590 [Rhodospirillales bacterium]
MKISSICTVHGPTPRIAVSRSISAASSSFSASMRSGTFPASAWAAMSRMAAIFDRGRSRRRVEVLVIEAKDVARRRKRRVEQREEAAEDRRRRLVP